MTTNRIDFDSLATCVEYLRKQYGGSEFVWIDVAAVRCHATDRPDKYPDSNVVPPDARYRIATRYEKGRWQQALPPYLFRGEPGAFATTFSSLDRLLNDPAIIYLDRNAIFQATNHVKKRLSDITEMSMLFSEGVCQHYGLPPSMIDVSSDLDVGLFFALGAGRSIPASGAIGVIDLGSWERPEGSDIALVDLTRHDWAPRPRDQRAYAVEDFVCGDLKDHDSSISMATTWHHFTLSGSADREQAEAHVKSRAMLLNASNDIMAGIVLCLIDEWVAQGNNMSNISAHWLASCVTHTRLVGIQCDGEDVLRTWAQAGYPDDEHAERVASERLWTGPFRRSLSAIKPARLTPRTVT